MINKQNSCDSCGPVAIMNTIQLLGGMLGESNYIDMFKTIGYRDNIHNKGTMSYCMSKWLEFFNIKYKKKNHPRVFDIESSIENGNIVILEYEFFDNNVYSGHFVVIDKSYNRFFRAYNAEKDGGNILEKYDLSLWMKRSKLRKHHKPIMWEISI
tara:strand:+ start:1669 stop:2133 length:465 start_codon:yes stop_codon:yes gene_type:complete